MILRELAMKFRDRTGVGVNESLRRSRHVLEALMAGVIQDGRVEIRGFGVFKAVRARARQYRNPTQGTNFTGGERIRIRFKASKRWLQKINKK